MTRKLLMIGIALVGLTLALGSNAWADGHGKGSKTRGNDKVYQQNHKTPPGNHTGWEKGKGNPHQNRYQNRPEYRDYDRDDRWSRDRDRDYHHKRPVVEKHVYHHYSSDERYDDGNFNVAVSIIDQVVSVAVAVSGAR